MTIFAITFRVHEDSTYQARYQSIIDAIKSADSSGQRWSETTSFFLIENASNSAGVADHIDKNSEFAETKDLLVVINLTQKAYKILGNYSDKDIDALMKRR